MRDVSHARMPDGAVVKGAQGNFSFERAAALTVNRFKVEQALGFERSFFGAPWIKPDPLREIQQMSLERLAEMPRRLKNDYVPTGFKGAGVTARAVKGHRFGLGLSASDRQALISFIKML